MPTFTDAVASIRSALIERYGERGPSPETGSFEAVVRAFLGRAGDDRAVRAALDALRDHDLLDPSSLAEADPASIEETWRASGARSLARSIRPLQRLSGWVGGRFTVVDTRLQPRDDAAGSTEAIREGLAGLNGVGPATTEAILLEGLGRPSYPVDRATYRILVRHGWLDADAGPDEARSLIQSALDNDPASLADFAGWFERIGRDACKAGVPRCDRCPLREFLPEGGPIDPS